jgi:hypothetical protein
MTLAALDDLLRQPVFGLHQAEKEKLLLPLLKDLTQHHRASCPAYRQITDLTCPKAASASMLSELPYLPISLFKYRQLRSISNEEIKLSVSSSGTSGSEKSHVDLDAETAKLSSKALNLVLGGTIGARRLPMLIIDCEAAIKGKDGIGARAAAILGLMPFGRDPCFALCDDMSVDENKISAFLKAHADEDILIYGFTFLIWQHFVAVCEKNNYDFSRATLLHSGGWKKLTDSAVDNNAFKARLKRAAGVDKVMNFYGMAELPGTIFVENADGLLYAPCFADILIRDPVTLEVLPQGHPGLIQILSALPHSYPGHSLLTEDIGAIEATDSGAGGRYGPALRIIGRVPRAVLRGCSDVLAASSPA